MAKTSVTRALLGVCALALLGGAQGCAQERDPINRVQDNVLPKSIFVRPDAQGRYLDDSDSWYFRATITDVPAAQSVAFIGAAGEMYRVKWRLDEKFLIAYREDADVLNAGESKGGVIAAFGIDNLDIRRAYNSATGEENNVIEENTSDRHWEYRDYVRVDWSTNKLSEAQFTAPGFESVSPVNYWERQKDSPDHPIFEKDYLDVTARFTVRPSIETCYYYYRDFGCGPGDISARLSFMKVPQRDYVPRDYPDRVILRDDAGDPIRSVAGTPQTVPGMDQFGFFRTERPVYDQRMGSLEQKYLYRANQWNLWDQWFQRDAKGNVVKDDQGKNVTLKYGDRKVRPIVYFVNPEFPEALKPIAQETGDAWNDAFSETVAGLRLFERKSDIGAALTKDEIRAEVLAMQARGEKVFVTCVNNPVKDGDPDACKKAVGGVGKTARQGDLRYSFMYWVPKPQPAGPLGFGPSYADPITGELFTASAYIYGAALDTYAQYATDVVNLLNGTYKPYEYINGVNAEAFARRLASGQVPGIKASSDADVPPAPGQQGFDLARSQAMVDRSLDKSILKTIADKGLPVASGGSSADRLAMIRGTPLERKILDNPETRMLFADQRMADPKKGVAHIADSLDDQELKDVGDLIFSHQDLAKKENDRLRFLGTHGCYYAAEFADDATLGLAKEIAKKYAAAGDPVGQEGVNKQIWQELRGHILRGVLEHEVGHTVGLRHNFEGSSDALNFFDQYWDAKMDSPAYGTPMSDNQKNAKMTEYQYSTVMDYGSRFNSDIHSLGKYDYAAIRFGYGGMVETFPKGKIKDPLYNSKPTAFSINFFNGYSAEVLDNIHRNYRHYTQMPGEFTDGIASIKSGGREIHLFDDIVEATRQQYLKAKDEKTGLYNTDTVKTGSRPGGPDGSYDVVPYQWCGDEFAGSANRPLCQRWDQGMDPFEVVQDAMSRWQNYYVFDAFTRGRVTGSNMLRGYLSRIATRYFAHIHSQYIHWLFYQGGQRYYWANVIKGVDKGYIGDTEWFKDLGGGLTASLATTWGLDRLVDVLGSPDVGVYLKTTDTTTSRDFFYQATSSPYACSVANNPVVCSTTATQLPLDIQDGARYRYTRYDSGTGSGFFNRIKNVGSFYDKIAALLTLTNSDTNFVGTDTTNAVSYRIGFYLLYPRAMTTVFGGVTSDDYDKFAWRYEFDDKAAQKASLLSRDLFQGVGEQDALPVQKTLKGTPVDSGWYFYYKAYALYFSMAQFQANFSQSWNDAVRVYCIGCGEAFTPAAGTTVVTMSDPFSGKQYAAIQYGDGRFSPGAQMINRGKALLDVYNKALALDPSVVDKQTQITNATNDLSNHIEMLDLIRGLYQTYGYSRF